MIYTNRPETLAELETARLHREAARHIVNCGCDECESDRIEAEREARAQERWNRQERMDWLRTHNQPHPPIWIG